MDAGDIKSKFNLPAGRQEIKMQNFGVWFHQADYYDNIFAWRGHVSIK
jgi:hypothetical protein